MSCYKRWISMLLERKLAALSQNVESKKVISDKMADSCDCFFCCLCRVRWHTMDSRHKELHDRANELLIRQQYLQAAQLYSELLESLQKTGQLTKGLKDLHISCLNKRATCHMKLVSIFLLPK